MTVGLPLVLSNVSSTELLVLLLALWWTFYYFLKPKPQLRFPPGPGLAFLIRDTFNLGSRLPEVILQRWAAKFGSLFPFLLVTDPLLKGQATLRVCVSWERPSSF